MSVMQKLLGGLLQLESKYLLPAFVVVYDVRQNTPDRTILESFTTTCRDRPINIGECRNTSRIRANTFCKCFYLRHCKWAGDQNSVHTINSDCRSLRQPRHWRSNHGCNI